MQLKLALAVCITVACALCGRSIAGAAFRRCRLLQALIEALRMLKVQSVSMLEPLEVALRRTEQPLFVQTAQRLPSEASAGAAWRAVRDSETARGKSADCLLEQDLAPLDRLFEHLGECSRAEQDEAIRTCIGRMESALSEARERSVQISRLYTSVGLLTGLAIAVIMI